MDASRRAAWAKYYSLLDKVPTELDTDEGGWGQEVTLDYEGQPLAVGFYGVGGDGRAFAGIGDPANEQRSTQRIGVYVDASAAEGQVLSNVLADEIALSLPSFHWGENPEISLEGEVLTIKRSTRPR